MAEINEIASLVSRGRAPAYEGGITPVLNQKCIRDGFLELEHLKHTNERTKPIPDWAELQGGDIVITSTGRGTIGRSLIGHDLGRLTCDSHVTIVRPSLERVEPAFLAVVLGRSKSDLEALATGSTNQTELNRTSISSFQVPIPPIDEQRRIADLLSAMDATVEQQTQRVTAAWALLSRATDAMTNDPAWLVSLDEVADVAGGITKGGRRSGASRAVVPYLRVANVQHGFLDLAEVKEIEATHREIERHALEPGDVLLLEGGNKEDVGRGWIWSREIDVCLHQNHLHRARPRPEFIEPRFLAYSVCRAEARAYCLVNGKQTSNLATINRTQISGLPIRVPDLAAQRRTVAALDAIRADWEAARVDGYALRGLRRSLVSVLLSGAHEIPASYDRFLAEAV